MSLYYVILNSRTEFTEFTKFILQYLNKHTRALWTMSHDTISEIELERKGDESSSGIDGLWLRSRLFGPEKVILDAIATAGKRLAPDAVEQGLMLNLPCRVITEQNGKYLNVTKVFAAVRGGWQ